MIVSIGCLKILFWINLLFVKRLCWLLWIVVIELWVLFGYYCENGKWGLENVHEVYIAATIERNRKRVQSDSVWNFAFVCKLLISLLKKFTAVADM